MNCLKMEIDKKIVKKLIDALEDSDIEDTLADNAIRIMGVLRQQTDDQFSKFSFISDFLPVQR